MLSLANLAMQGQIYKSENATYLLCNNCLGVVIDGCTNVENKFLHFYSFQCFITIFVQII